MVIMSVHGMLRTALVHGIFIYIHKLTFFTHTHPRVLLCVLFYVWRSCLSISTRAIYLPMYECCPSCLLSFGKIYGHLHMDTCPPSLPLDYIRLLRLSLKRNRGIDVVVSVAFLCFRERVSFLLD